MRSGLFITFEGSEACGKTTQIQRLAAHFTAIGRESIVTREPGGTPAGEAIRDLVKHSKQGWNLTPEAELLLFTASRAQLTRELIQPALNAGRVIISDRYLDSTTVYQGIARKIDSQTVKRINDFAVGDCLPDITFLFDLDVATAFERLAQRNDVADRIESQPTAFFEAVRRGYLELAQKESQRFVIIDAAKSEDEIEAEIWATLTARCADKI
ncbi:MAG TPA: dTMP kinase [Chthoniobacterales bacterium]